MIEKKLILVTRALFIKEAKKQKFSCETDTFRNGPTQVSYKRKACVEVRPTRPVNAISATTISSPVPKENCAKITPCPIILFEPMIPCLIILTGKGHSFVQHNPSGQVWEYPLSSPAH